jgi:hypothetical protein
LERSQIRVQVGELNRSQASEIGETIVSSVLIDNEGDILKGVDRVKRRTRGV